MQKKSNEKIAIMQSLFEREKSQTKVHSEVYIVTGKGAKWSARPQGARGALHELDPWCTCPAALCPAAARGTLKNS